MPSRWPRLLSVLESCCVACASNVADKRIAREQILGAFNVYVLLENKKASNINTHRIQNRLNYDTIGAYKRIYLHVFLFIVFQLLYIEKLMLQGKPKTNLPYNVTLF